jgi:sRNA-binding regulator protein Hfq
MKLDRIILLLFLISCFSTYGQLEQTTVLKNGSEVKGKIIYEDSVKIKVKTKDGSKWVYKQDEIDTIKPVSGYNPHRGPFINIEPLISTGEQTNVYLHLKAGLNFNRKWGVAIGASVENYANHSRLPLYLELKYHIFNHYITPYLAIQGGYMFPINDLDHQNEGFMIGGSLNMVCYTSDHFGITIGGGYRFNRLVRSQEVWNLPVDDIYIHHINRIELKIGLIFK